MSKLLEKQFKFSLMVTRLVYFAESEGYKISLGYAYRDPEGNKLIGGHPKSLHTKRLAIDLNLFKDGVYLKKTEDYTPLGEYWESLGGSWGGRFNDGNHFSLEHKGIK